MSGNAFLKYSFNKDKRLCDMCKKKWFVPNSPGQIYCKSCVKLRNQERSREANRKAKQRRHDAETTKK